MEVHFELRRAHTQHKKPIIKSKSKRPILKYLKKRLVNPFYYDIQKWIWDGKDWACEDLTGEDFIIS